MSVTPSPIGGFAAQFFDNNGVILSGGKIFTYAAGTTTPQASYTSASGVTPHSNPIILDSAGRVPGGEIWLTDGLVYKFVIETATGILLGTYDNITGVNSNFVNYTIQEEVITATAGQTVFNLSTITYTPGTNSLTVYIDGVNQYVGDSYIETDSNTVTFTSGVHVGGEVKFTTAIQTTTSAINASAVAYDPPFVGAVSTNVQDKLAQYVSVTDFGAVGDGVADDTAAFNLATMATTAHGGNDDLAMRRQIYVPAGDYKIQGTVYVRKGQTLCGAGDGATRILAGTQTSSGRAMFKLGFGFIGGVPVEDAGGLPPVIENLATLGGDSSGGVVDMRVAGAQARNLFITSAGVSVVIGGADTILSNCIIDQGLNGLNISGQNHIIDSCLFYVMRYGITFNNSYDVQVNNCHFEYSIYDDILFSDTITDAQNIAIQNCQFVKNEQYATSDYAIHLRSTNTSVVVHGCEFRNQRGYSIGIATGTGNDLRVSNCVFNGLKTNPAYAQSTTAAGIYLQNGIAEVTNCTFENLFGNPIAVNSILDVPTTIKSCSYSNITTATSFVTVTSSTGDLTVTSCVGDDVLPLINLQNNIVPRLKHNTRWLGAAGTSGGRYFWRIPTTNAALVNVGVTANALPGGSLNYRDASSIYAVRSVDFNVVTQDVASKYTIYETPASGLIGPLDIQVELNTVGGGATGTYTVAGRYLAVSVPATYANVKIDADFVI
jgi:hypothetical protein